MSRTDKDAPYWVRTEWYKPDHYCGWHRRTKFEPEERETTWGLKYTTYKVVGYKWEYVGDCDLPEIPIRQNRRISRKRRILGEVTQRCTWWATWPENENAQMRGRRKKFWRHSEFYGPQRAAVRDTAREVIKGNHEMEFPDGRHRHSVLWDW